MEHLHVARLVENMVLLSESHPLRVAELLRSVLETQHAEGSNLGFWLAVCQLAHSCDADKVPSHVLKLRKETAPAIVERAIQTEIANTGHIQEVFRHESWLFAIFKEFVRKEIYDFVKTILKPVLKQALKIRVLSPDKKLKLLEHFVSSFESVAPSAPLRVCFAFFHVRREAMVRFGDSSPVAASVFFLRFVCPCIIDPSKYGLAKPPKPEQNQNLLSFSKLLLEVVKAKYESAASIVMETSQTDPALLTSIQESIQFAHDKLHSSFNNIIAQKQLVVEGQRLPMQGQELNEDALLSIATFLCSVERMPLRKALRSNRAPQRIVFDLCSAIYSHSSDSSNTLSTPNTHFLLPESGLESVLRSNLVIDTDSCSHPSQWGPAMLQNWLAKQNLPLEITQCMNVTGQQFLSLKQTDFISMGVTALGYQKKLLRAQTLLQEECGNWKPNESLPNAEPFSTQHFHCLREPTVNHMVNGSPGEGLQSLNDCDVADKLSLSLSLKAVQLWTPEEVGLWLREQGLGAYEEDALTQSVTGKALLSLTDRDLDKLNIYALGHRKKLLSLIKELPNRPSLGGAYSWSVEQVEEWLQGIGLPQYQDNFRENDVNGWVLMCLQDQHLQAFGVTALGHRKTILRKRKILETRTEKTDVAAHSAPPSGANGKMHKLGEKVRSDVGFPDSGKVKKNHRRPKRGARKMKKTLTA